VITVADVIDIFNFPPYGCSRRLYYEKIGNPSHDACSINDEHHKKRITKLYGEVLADIYRQTTKRKVRTPNFARFIDPEYPYIIADPDRLVTNIRGRAYLQYVPLEIRILKRAEFYEIRRNGLAGNYYTYMMHHLMIGKTSKWAALALFCPDVMEMKTFDIAYDEVVAAEVIAGEKRFWEAVQTKNPLTSLKEERLCELCGYRHQCGDFLAEYTKEMKEKTELCEEITQINYYLDQI
jgi:hypothetical protein